jgi:hypothetical protein
LIVSEIDAARVRELYQVRSALDALAARRAAERIAGRVIDPQQRRAAQQALAAGLALHADAPVLAFIQADVAFHTALYRLSGNRVIEGTVAAQWPHLKRSMGAVLDGPEERPLVWAEHREILRIILVWGTLRAPSTRRGTIPTAPAPNPLARSPDRSCQREETVMPLTAQQLRQFAEEGYLFLPGCFLEAEVAILRDEAEQIYATNRQEVWREKTGAPRTAFAAQTYNEAFRLLGHHPRLIGPVEQVFGEKLYMHQYKINAKAAFEGDVWQWHQDYGTWARDDGMPEPRAMNIAVFMDEVMPINGPLMLVPRSHKHGDPR